MENKRANGQAAADEPTVASEESFAAKLQALGLDVVEPSGKGFVVGVPGSVTGESARWVEAAAKRPRRF